jgi:lysozyme family protein
MQSSYEEAMSTVRDLAYEIVGREGGYVNDPDDPGGATKYGVTIGTLRRLGMGQTIADVKALTIEDAVDIYLVHYFERPKINLLPEGLQATVFDMYVNAGGNAIKILQRLLVQFGVKVAIDGALGPNTAAAVKKVFNDYFVDAYGIARRNYYFSLADRRVASRKYARTRSGGKGGWIKRAEEFISPKYRMTDEAFRARTAQW